MGREQHKGRRKQRNELNRRRVPLLGYYYIVTDTEQTEKNYLEGLRDSIPDVYKGKLVIKVVKEKTINLVKRCMQDVVMYPQYCEPWIIFDRDQVKDFDNIIADAERNNVHTGWSNPCFEIWLFAYFGSMSNIQDSVSCCNKFSIEYEKRIGHKYDKANKELYNKLCQFGDEEKAIQIAENKRMQCENNGSNIPSKMIPYTTMDILIKEIRSKINSMEA